MKCSLDISNFLEEISSLSHSIVFLYFFALIAEEGFISPSYSLELCTQMDISFLFSFAFHFSSFLSFCKTSSDNHFAPLPLFFLGMVLITASCTMSCTSIHSSSGTQFYFSWFPPYLQLFPPLKSWTPQSQPWGLESTSSSRWIYFIQKVIGIYFIQKVKCLCWYFDLFSWITNVLHGT